MKRNKIVLYNPDAVFFTMPLALLAVGSTLAGSMLDSSRYTVHIIDGRLERDAVGAVLAEIDDALFADIRRQGADAVVVQPIFTSQRTRVVELATMHQLAVTSDFALYAEAGALFSFGVDDGAQLRRTAYFVDRILKGARPADLPIEQPTKFQLVINTVAAGKLGWPLSPLLLARADRVIE